MTMHTSRGPQAASTPLGPTLCPHQHPPPPGPNPCPAPAPGLGSSSGGQGHLVLGLPGHSSPHKLAPHAGPGLGQAPPALVADLLVKAAGLALLAELGDRQAAVGCPEVPARPHSLRLHASTCEPPGPTPGAGRGPCHPAAAPRICRISTASDLAASLGGGSTTWCHVYPADHRFLGCITIDRRTADLHVCIRLAQAA